MEGRKLLDAHVLNGRQEIAKHIVTNFRRFLKLFLFTLLNILKLKSIHCSTSFCRKKENQLDRKKEIEAMGEERK